MTTRKEVVLVCDQCGAEGGMVQTYRVTVGGVTVEAENCDDCWASLAAAFGAWARSGRTIPPRRTPRGAAWPGTPWKFTHHAMERMGQRHINPDRVLGALDDPEVVRPGNGAGEEVRVRGRIKVVCNPERWTVLTVADREQEDAGDLGAA